jgi:hypothetical protein
VTSVKKRTLSLAQLNLELAKLEGKQKAAELGIGRAWARLPLF